MQDDLTLSYKYKGICPEYLKAAKFPGRDLGLAKKKVEKPVREVTKRQLSRRHQEGKRQRIVTTIGIVILAVVLIIIGVGWFATQYRPLRQTVIEVNDTEFDMGYYVKMLEAHSQDESPFLVADHVVEVIRKYETTKQTSEDKLGITVSKDEIKQALGSSGLPSDKVYQDIIAHELLLAKLENSYFEKMVPKTAEHRRILAMFLEGESQAVEVRDRLEQGTGFTELADEFNLDQMLKEQEGDPDWQAEGILDVMSGSQVLGDYVFNAGIGELSQPIYDAKKPKNVGYWIVEVLDRDEDGEEADVQAILLGSEEEAWVIKDMIKDGEEENFADVAKEYSQLRGAWEDAGYLGWITSGTFTPALDEAIFGFNLALSTLSEPIRDDDMVTRGGFWLVKILDKDEARQFNAIDRELLKNKALDDWLIEAMESSENVIRVHLDDQRKGWAITRVLRNAGS